MTYDLAKKLKDCSKCGVNQRHQSKKGRVYSWCKTCISRKQTDRYWGNREVELQRRKDYIQRNPEKVKEARRKTHWKIKLDTLSHYGSVCACCKEADPKFLAIDHVNNNGAEERRENKSKRGGSGLFYYWLKNNKYPNGYQVLCHNCNMAKAFYKSCPHQS